MRCQGNCGRRVATPAKETPADALRRPQGNGGRRYPTASSGERRDEETRPGDGTRRQAKGDEENGPYRFCVPSAPLGFSRVCDVNPPPALRTSRNFKFEVAARSSIFFNFFNFFTCFHLFLNFSAHFIFNKVTCKITIATSKITMENFKNGNETGNEIRQASRASE